MARYCPTRYSLPPRNPKDPFFQATFCVQPSDDQTTFDMYTVPMNSTYQAYLLRFQRNETQQQWRVTIQNVNSGEQLHFVTEQELFRYLAQALAIQLPSSSQPSAKQS